MDAAQPRPPVRLLVDGAVRTLSDGERRATIGIDRLTLRAGTAYALCGPSGIGKTTALEMLSLAKRPDRVGAMVLTSRDGTRIDLAATLVEDRHAEASALRGTHFGYVVQTSRLFPFLTARQNVALAQTIAGTRDEAFVDALMARLSIADLGDARPAALSGGQRQRVCIARALAHRPSIVLADEPTSAVDREVALTIVETLAEYARTDDAAVLVITHNVALAREADLAMLQVESSSAAGSLTTRVADAPARAQGLVHAAAV